MDWFLYDNGLRLERVKANNETIKMNRNYSNIDKRIWTGKYVHEHYAYSKCWNVNVGSFPQ